MPTYIRVRTEESANHGDGLRLKPGGFVELVREDGTTETLFGVRNVVIDMTGNTVPTATLTMRSNFEVAVDAEVVV